MAKRNLDICVISDVHLGTYGCQAKALYKYLKSINPETLILNGDIIDIWQFNKNYWPDSHMRIIQRIFKMMSNGTNVFYLTGNHDEMLRKFADFKMGRLQILNKLVLNLDGKTAWFFHGDVFDITMKNSKWLAKLGAIGYDTLILINSFVNWVSAKLGRGKISLSKRIKNSVKKAVKFISDFEQTAIDIAIEKQYDFVVCGHIHQPALRLVQTQNGTTTYLNSGDWIENLTALEYNNSEWKLYHYNEKEEKNKENDDDANDEVEEMKSINIEELLKTIIS
ncbi:MAG: UDP-2,3-diacylglucosamine diphosphatase [Bacteroidia bacterium]